MATFKDYTTEELLRDVIGNELKSGLQKRLQAIHAEALGLSVGSPVAAETTPRCVVTSRRAECVVSSGGSIIASCDYTDGLGTVHRGVACKLSKDHQSLKRQFELLRLMNATANGCFIGVLDFLGPVELSCAHGADWEGSGVADCSALIMIRGSVDMNRVLWYVSILQL